MLASHIYGLNCPTCLSLFLTFPLPFVGPQLNSHFSCPQRASVDDVKSAHPASTNLSLLNSFVNSHSF